MKSYFNEYLESEMKSIKLQGEVDSLAMCFKYFLKTCTDEQFIRAKEFIDLVTISEKTKTTIYDSRFIENRENQARTNAETTC
jgi:hypothetical protein